jgi:hypothetical protein
MADCKKCGKPGNSFITTDNFGELGNRKIELSLCGQCEALYGIRDPAFMHWLADYLRTLRP